MEQLAIKHNQVGRPHSRGRSLLPTTIQPASVLALLLVIIGGCVIKNSTAGATPCTDVEVTPSHAEVIRCAYSQDNLTDVMYDGSGRVVSYQFDVSCSDGRHHTGTVTFSYASPTDPGTIQTMTVDGGTCANSTGADAASASAGSGAGGAPGSGGVTGTAGTPGSDDAASSSSSTDDCTATLFSRLRSPAGVEPTPIAPDQLPTLADLQGQAGIDWSPVEVAGDALANAGLVVDPTERATGGLQAADAKYYFFSLPVGYTGNTTSRGGIGIKIDGYGSSDVYVEMFQQPAEGTGSFGVWYSQETSVTQCALTPQDIAGGNIAYAPRYPAQEEGTTPPGARIARLAPKNSCAACNSIIQIAQSYGAAYGATAVCAPLLPEALLPGLLCEYFVSVYFGAAAKTLEAWADADPGLICTPMLRLCGSIASDFVCPTNRDCSVPPPTSGESVACYECQVGCGCANDLISSAASTILCGALPIKVDNNLCGAVVGEAIAGAMSGTPQSCDNVCNKQCTARDGGTPDSPEGDASTCISGGAADLENPVGAYVFEFIGSDSATISGGGGYQADYDLLVGADLQSNFAGLESYTVRSAALRVDVAYSSTPLCTDSNTGQTVKCDYPLAECITGTFVTDDFDLTGALLIHEAPGAASNPLPDDFYEIKFALAGAKSFPTARGTILQYASGEELFLGTASDSEDHEAGYFHSNLVLPAPYVQLGISPGEPIQGQASITGRDAGVGP